MIRDTRFAYAQARLQARHGMRPTEQLWLRVASAGNLSNYLQQARHTSLRPWVLGIQDMQSSHAIELALRRYYRGYIDEVARWLPAHWSAVVQWTRRLPDLPALQHLLRGEPAPAWLLEDPHLRPFGSDNITSRMEALLASDCNALAIAWQRGVPLYVGWLEHWQRQWPASRRYAAGLAYLGRLLREYMQTLPAQQSVRGDSPRQRLIAGLGYAFRRYSFEPAAACAHLGLIALDLEMLRGDLLQRALFTETAGGRA